MHRPCLEPRCPDPALYRGRCRRHSRLRERATHPNKDVYGTAKWANTRRRVLFEQPLCECGEIATDVHHRVDLQDGGDRWARSNLVAHCHSCHSRMTRERQQHAGSMSDMDALRDDWTVEQIKHESYGEAELDELETVLAGLANPAIGT